MTTLTRPDVLVVGGGIMGMLSARELAQAGLSVTLLERGTTGRESTWAGGGILSPIYPWRYADPVNHLARWSQAAYPRLAAALLSATGIDPQWTRNGMLVLDPEAEREGIPWGQRFATTVEALPPGAQKALEPGLHEEVPGAVWMPEVAQLRNPRLAKALRADLGRLGVRVEEGVTATGLRRRGTQVVGVETDRGPYAAGTVVLCAGAWTGQLLARMGLSPLPVRPVRGQMVLFRAPVDTVHRILIHRGHYLIPRRDGRVLVGSTLEEVGFDKSVTDSARQALVTLARRLIPALAHCPVEAHWAGLRPGSPQGIPFIGPLPEVRGVFVNAGHFRNGVVTAPASVRLLADLVLQRPPCLDPTPYLPQARRALTDNPG